MKIIVSVKQVPVRDSALRLDAGSRWLDESDLSYEMNEPDAYALEEALQLKEKSGGEVVVLCAGPARALQTIREALAKGADRAIHVEVDQVEVDQVEVDQVEVDQSSQLDALVVARLLAKAAQPEAADLILTGLQSDDMGYGQTGVILAELLGNSHATIVMQVEPQDGFVRVKRELEDGWFQNIVLPLPAVLTVQSGIKKLRYATLMGIKKAKTKQVKTLKASELGVDLKRATKVRRVYLPQRTKQSQILSGDAKQAAHQLVEKLRFEARAL